MGNDYKWAVDTAKRIKEKISKTAERNRYKFPFRSMNGTWDDQSDNVGAWTNGFYGGIMWQMYYATKEEIYKEIAMEHEVKLDASLFNIRGLDHDSGFRWLPTAVANYRLTGNEAARNRGLLAAGDMAGRFNLAGNFIRCWNDTGDGSKAGWVIIDCMMNLPLLYWASKELNDPRFKQIAVRHADTAAKYVIREDGSANHIVEFDPVTGEFIQTHSGQGYTVGSSWTRGQAWAIYGFVLSYIHTGEERFLTVSKRVANYFIANIPKSGFIPIDFRQPLDCHMEDSTAAVIAACGLLELAKRVEEADGAVYHRTAVRLLRTLAESRCNWDENVDHILEKCTSSWREEIHEYGIVYGDYYFMEAIWKLTGWEHFIW